MRICQPVDFVPSSSEVVALQIVSVVFVDFRSVVFDGVDVPDVDSRRCCVGLDGDVAVDEVATQEVAVELEERQEVVPEIFDVLVLHV